MAARVVTLTRTEPTLLERLYLPEIFKGLARTLGHLLQEPRGT